MQCEDGGQNGNCDSKTDQYTCCSHHCFTDFAVQDGAIGVGNNRKTKESKGTSGWWLRKSECSTEPFVLLSSKMINIWGMSSRKVDCQVYVARRGNESMNGMSIIDRHSQRRVQYFHTCTCKCTSTSVPSRDLCTSQATSSL